MLSTESQQLRLFVRTFENGVEPEHEMDASGDSSFNRMKLKRSMKTEVSKPRVAGLTGLIGMMETDGVPGSMRLAVSVVPTDAATRERN